MPIAFSGLVLFSLFIYFEPALLIPGLAEVRPALILGIFALGASFIAGATSPKAIQNKLLLLLLLIAVTASHAAPLPPTEHTYDSLAQLAKAVAFYFILTRILTSKDYFRRFFFLSLGLTTLVSLVTLFTTRAGIPALTGHNPYRMVNYFGGIGDDPNEFGAFLLAFLPLPIVLLESQRSLFKKLLYGGVAAVFLLNIIRTRSRGAFLGLLAIAAVIAWDNRRKVGRLLLLAAIAAAISLHVHAGYWERISTLSSTETIVEDGSAYSRVSQIQYSLLLLASYPLTGVGIRNFVPAKILLLGLDPSENSTRHVAHNAYLNIGAETGLPGLAVFLAVIVLSIVQSYRNERFFRAAQSADSALFWRISRGVRYGWIGFLCAIFFLSEQYNLILYQWTAFTVVLNALAIRGTSASSHESARKGDRTVSPLTQVHS